MSNVSHILRRWPSMGEFAADIGVKPKHAYQMKFRGSIPVTYWQRMVAAAPARKISLKYEELVSAHGSRAPAEAERVA